MISLNPFHRFKLARSAFHMARLFRRSRIESIWRALRMLCTGQTGRYSMGISGEAEQIEQRFHLDGKPFASFQQHSTISTEGQKNQ